MTGARVRDPKDEVLEAMEFYVINPNLPVNEEDFVKIRAYVWTKRKHTEQIIKHKAREAPGSLAATVRGEAKKAPESPPEEVMFWAMSQRSLLVGEFEPQVQVGPYRLDFGFPSVKLCVEVDGQQYHSSPADLKRDQKRTDYLSSCGWTVIRFTAKDVFNNSMTVADKISRIYSTLLKAKGISEPWENRNA